MCYSPYLCIICENVEDNGWLNNKHKCQYSELVNLQDVKIMFNLNIELTTLIYDKYCSTPTTYSLCKKCYRKYRYKKEKSQGICLKLYSKIKINGKWSNLNFNKIK
jgi:hypothetical protein